MTDPDNPPLDAFSNHEVLHTASIMATMFDDHIAQHRYVQADPELAAEAEAIGQRLADFYQMVGRKAAG
jgi:hypothetical protein